MGVERCAARLGKILLPYDIDALRAAAILHDITKEIEFGEQIKILENSGFCLTDEDRKTPGVLHSFTAPVIIERDFSEFAKGDILSAVFKHTVGDREMNVFDKIIFVSDYAEDTRNFESCKRVRNFLFENFENLAYEEAIIRLNEACLASINGALEALKKDNRPINSRIYDTKISLLKNILQN